MVAISDVTYHNAPENSIMIRIGDVGSKAMSMIKHLKDGDRT